MKITHTNKAPAAIGPYSQAVQVGDFVFCSGQIGLDPTSMKLIEGGVKSQTRQVFLNIEAVLESSNLSLSNVVKVQVFIQNMDHFSMVNEIYGDFMKGHKPARDTIEVSKLPLEALIEISVVAYRASPDISTLSSS